MLNWTELQFWNRFRSFQQKSAISKIPSSEPSTASVGKWKIHIAEICIRKKVIFVGQISTRKVIFVDLVIIFAAKFGKRITWKTKQIWNKRKMTTSPGTPYKQTKKNKQRTKEGKQTNKEKCLSHLEIGGRFRGAATTSRLVQQIWRWEFSIRIKNLELRFESRSGLGIRIRICSQQKT